MNTPTPQSESTTDPSAILQGHNARDQTFTCHRSVRVTDHKCRKCQEYLLGDQFGNKYLVYRSLLSDTETYDVGDWVKPSTIESHGGFTDSVFELFRAQAFGAFDAANQNIAQHRHQSSETAPDMPSNMEAQYA